MAHCNIKPAEGGKMLLTAAIDKLQSFNLNQDQ